MGREVYVRNPYAEQVIKLLVYVNCDKLVNEESVTMNSRKVSGIKTTHRSKMLPKIRKQIKFITTHRLMILKSYLFIQLIFVNLLAQ